MRSTLVYGTFDPLTSGHLWLAFTGLRLFDRLVVAIAPVVNREPMFTAEERVEMWKKSLDGWGEGRVEAIAVGDDAEVDLARDHGCESLLVGVRNMAEYMERAVWQRVLHDLDPAIQPVHLFPDARVADISASKVRALVGRDGWVEAVKPYLPPYAFESLYWKVRGSGRNGDRRVGNTR